VDVVAISITKADLSDKLADFIPPALHRGHQLTPSGLCVSLVLHTPEVPHVCLKGRTSPRFFKLREEVGIYHFGSLFFRFRSHVENAFVISLKSPPFFNRLEPLPKKIEHRHSVLDRVALELPVKGRGYFEV